jgi:hypothetical protein
VPKVGLNDRCAPTGAVDVWRDEEQKDSNIRFIKIDVEGGEVSVLRSCAKLIEAQKPLLYIEVDNDHLSRFGDQVGQLQAALNTYEYDFFRNIGPRNSGNDRFRIAKIDNLVEGGSFFDLFAVHRLDPRYPEKFVGPRSVQ